MKMASTRQPIAHFNGVIQAHKALADAGEESMLVDDSQYQEQLYISGLAALNADDIAAARPLFEELSGMGYDKPAIYEALYKIAASGADDLDDDARLAAYAEAYTYLEDGRTKFPDDVSLLFAEINHFLRINKLDELISKLETAIEKEPENVSLYSTLGNVYDNLYQRETQEAGNAEKANEYFDEALVQYNRALEKDPNFTDATYSIGALYFNRAANMTQELSVLADDFTKEGQARYDALKIEIEEEFDRALPFFIEVERKSPSDMNTLIALKEIYARKNDFTLSNEFKARLEAVQAGQSVESYFENN